MTDLQRKQIREQRADGKGYLSIGKSVGLSRDLVRAFCRRNKMQGYGQAAALNIKESVEKGLLCKNCHSRIGRKHTGRPPKFCSDKCRYEWWNRERGGKK